MSVIASQDIIYESYFSGGRVFLEPKVESSRSIPFLETQVLRPELFKAGILQLNETMMAHPGVNLARIYDPIVTVTENYIDFEAFARFAHSYCKIRFPDKLFKDPIRQEGSTNVDFNPRFIRDLSNRFYTNKLWLSIDPEGVGLSLDDSVHLLKKVSVPKWWKPAYKELKRYVRLETMEPRCLDAGTENYRKVILSGNAFEQLIDELKKSYLNRGERIRSLFLDENWVKLLLGGKNAECGASVKLLKSCCDSVRLWGVWRIRNLAIIADQIVQADIYASEKHPSFWVLHARSGVEVLFGFTPYTNALWTSAAQKEVENLLKNPYSEFELPPRGRRKRQYRRRRKIRNQKNFVRVYPGQRIIPDYFPN
jgi:hypothetical protein